MLDDVWEAGHLRQLNCVDAEVGSCCVVTTRIRDLAVGEAAISCGLLSLDESLSLLLSSAGLTHLIESPPVAALEAVECCGRLALALPIAGRMMASLEDVWQTELVPILRAELAEELSTEQRIVNASLRCLEESQRAGVEALFDAVGVFAEDTVVPSVIIDALAPLVSSLAGEKKPSKLRVRTWLKKLIDASLVSGSVIEGIAVHDLVRDVMMARADAREGGMVGLQREALRLLVAAFESTTSSTDEKVNAFLLGSIRHHASASLAEDARLPADELLMRVLCAQSSLVCAAAVAGLGLDRVKEQAAASEAAGAWWDAAQLWSAAATPRGPRGGEELKRVWAAVKQLPQETEDSRALEFDALKKLHIATEGGYDFSSPEFAALNHRMAELAAAKSEADSSAGVAMSYDTLATNAASAFNAMVAAYGGVSHVPATLANLADAKCKLMHANSCLQLAARAAPTRLKLDEHAQSAAHLALWFSLPCEPALREAAQQGRMEAGPGGVREELVGAGGALFRENVDRYDFAELSHGHKTGLFDWFMWGGNEAGLLLWYGDLRSAKAGWAKQLDCWRQVNALVQSGDTQWATYQYESQTVLQAGAGAMLAAGETALLRELYLLTLHGTAFQDAAVMAELETALAANPFLWVDEETGQCWQRKQTLLVHWRALGVIVEEKGAQSDPSELRAWLPSVEELIYTAEHECIFARTYCGAAHPALTCATLYADRLGEYSTAVAVVEGLLAIPPAAMHAAARIEALRLLAKCTGAQGDAAAALDALERGVTEAQATGHVWYHACCLRDMLAWVQADNGAAVAGVQLRIRAVEAGFVLSGKD